MGLRRITPPSDLPVSVDELKVHLRIDSDDFDEDLELKLNAAVEHVETLTRRALIEQTWELSLPRFPREIRLPKGNLIGTPTIRYLNVNGTDTTLPTTDYAVSANVEPAVIVPAYAKAWPAFRDFLNSVRIEFTCGYGDDPDEVPSDLRAAILLYAGWLFEGVETDMVLGGTETAREKTFAALWMKHRLDVDECSDAILA